MDQSNWAERIRIQSAHQNDRALKSYQFRSLDLGEIRTTSTRVTIIFLSNRGTGKVVGASFWYRMH